MKTIKKQLKRAFTIVELVIVIAVVAALAAILIPTFVNVVNSANEANDTSLAKNMNTTLAAYGILNGEPDTAHEALQALKDDGFLLENMTPTADGCNYVWNETDNTVALLSDDFEVLYSNGDLDLADTNSTNTADKITLWAIVSTQDQVEAFQNSGYTFSYCVVSEEELEVDNSFDSCMVTNANVTLKASGTSYTIYTNGGEVTIDAGSATVNHIGTATLVNVNSVADNSYHLNGELTMAVVSNGRMVVDENTKVSYLTINNSSGNSPKLTIKSQDGIGQIIYAEDGYASLIEGEYSNVSTVQNSSVATGVSGITYITGSSSDEVTSNFKSFIASGYGIAVLQTNVTTDSAITLTSGNFVMIDLNGFTLTSTYTSSNNITKSSELTISNGTLSFKSISGITTGVFVAETNSKITLSSVYMSTNGTALFPKSTASEVNVINSTLYVTGAYCVATNASTAYTCTTKIENSTLISAYTPICFNVPGTYAVTDSEIISTSASPSVIVRGGTATIDNCKIYNNFTDYLDKAYVIWNARMDDWTKQDTAYTYGTAWASGNGTAYAALCIGNDADSTSYQYAAKCTVTNTEIHTNKGYMCVYIEGNSTEAYGATFDYSNCSFYYHDSAVPYEDTTNGTAYSNSTPTQYSSSLFDSNNSTNPLNYAIIYTSDTASYVTINGKVYQDGNN